MKKYSLQDIADGFVYWAIKIEPDRPIEQAMNHYWAMLRSKNIDPRFDDYFSIFCNAEDIKNSSPAEKEYFLDSIGLPSVFWD